MPYPPHGKPPHGSTAWAAQRIQRLLDREEREAKERAEHALLEDAASFELRNYPFGSEAWAAQQIRLIQQREAREKLRALSARRTRQGDDPPYRATRPSTALPSQGLLAGYPTSPEAAEDNHLLQPVVAPAIPWIIGAGTQIPAWALRLAPLLGLSPLLRGDVEDDDYDFCHRRWDAEKARCRRWPERWLGPCLNRARERFKKCYRHGGRPDPEEPHEWGPGDMEEWYNPDK